MNDFDYLGLDALTLQSLLCVYEEGSVSKAAIAMSVTQSTLSHRLERARVTIDDRLFVRSGRSVQPTQRLKEIVPAARAALDAMRTILEPTDFSSAEISDTFVIAATDYERTVFLIDAFKSILKRAPKLRINFMWLEYDNTESLRRNLFDMAISPFEGSDAQDIVQRTLFSETTSCFYDADMIGEPSSLDAYLAGRHVGVIFSESDTSFIDDALARADKKRNIVLKIPSLSELPGILKGTDLIATVPTRLKHTILSSFAHCPPPFEMQRLTYKLFWHQQTHDSKKHAWLRQQIVDFISHRETLQDEKYGAHTNCASQAHPRAHKHF